VGCNSFYELDFQGELGPNTIERWYYKAYPSSFRTYWTIYRFWILQTSHTTQDV